MSGESFDVQGEVRDALNTAVGSYGKRVLNDPRVLGNLVTDLLPDHPRERSLLVAAAEAGVASELTQNVEGQNMDADTAVALAARSLAENRSLDPAASSWVAAEYARALGYQVRSEAPLPWDNAGSAWGTPLSGAPSDPQHAPTMTTNQPLGSWPGSAAPPVSPPASPWPPATTPPASPWGQNSAPVTPQNAVSPQNQGSAQNPGSAQNVPPSPWGAAPTATFGQGAPSGPGMSGGQGVSGGPGANSGPGAPGAVSGPSGPGAPAGYGGPVGLASMSGPGAPSGGPGAPPAPGGPGGPGGPWGPNPGGPGAPWPSAPAQPKSPRRNGIVAGGVVVGIVVLYLIAASITSVFPFSSSKPSGGTAAPGVSSPTPVTPKSSGPASSPAASAPASSPAAGPAPSGVLAAGVKPLKVLMPYDLTDVNTECEEQAKIPFNLPGLVRGLECVAPDMASGQIFGYQVDNHADYLKAWANYNSWSEFGTSNTLSCPPTSGNSQGGPGEWWGPRFAKKAGQVLECFTSSTGPVYVWTYPSENAFVIAQPPKDKEWTFSKLETWWEDNAV